MKTNKITDLILWQAFKSGDKEAFSKIYQENIDDLLSYGYRITGDRQLIRDSIQDLFLNLWQTRLKISDTDSIRFYLYRSLRNKILEGIKKNKYTEIDSTNLFEDIIGALSIEEDLIETEQMSEQLLKLKRAIQQLPKRQQEIIQLRYYHDFSFDKIAEMMQINNQSVRNLLHRAIAELRQFFYIFWWLVIPFLVWYKKN